MTYVRDVEASDLVEAGLPVRTSAAVLAAACQVEGSADFEVDEHPNDSVTITFANGSHVTLRLDSGAGFCEICGFGPDSAERWHILPEGDITIRENADVLARGPIDGTQTEIVPSDQLAKVLATRFRELARA